MESKLNLRLKAVDDHKKNQPSTKIEIYLGILDELSAHDRAYTSVLKKVREGLDTMIKQSKKETDVQ